MASRDVEELVRGVWCWERRPRGLRPGEFGGRTGYAIVTESDMLLVDPLVDGDDDPVVDVLDDLVCGDVRILVTMPYHTRSAEWLWRRYRSANARIYGHPAVATRLGDVSGFEGVRGGSGVDGIARFHSIGRPPRSQQPIEIPSVRALAFGDAIVEIGGGELRIWAASPDSDRRRSWWNAHYLPSLAAGRSRHRARPRNAWPPCDRPRQGGAAARTRERPVAAPEAPSAELHAGAGPQRRR
jgi:hypothetical protein